MAALPKLGVSQLIRTTTATVASVIESADIFTSYIDKVREDQKEDHKNHRLTFGELNRAKYVAEVMACRKEVAALAKTPEEAAMLQEIIDMFKSQ